MIKTLVGPTKPEDKTLTERHKVVKYHLAPTTLVIAESYAFYNRRHLGGENVTDFMKELRKLASSGELHDDYIEMTSSRHVSYPIDKVTQCKLLSKYKLTLTEERAVCKMESMCN